MSKLKVKDLRSLSASELDHKKAGFEKDLFDLRQKRVTGQLDKPHQFKQIRRQIARINTLKRESKNV